MGTTCRGIRGATTAASNTAEDILEATLEMMHALIVLNDLQTEDIASAIFTTTPDVTACFPAEAARGLGMHQVPLLCASEIAVPHGMPRIIRILLHINTDRPQREMVHVYLGEAKKLRPDVCSAQ